MPVTNYQGPLYFHSIQRQKYRDEYDRIFRNKEVMSEQITETSEPVEAVATTITPDTTPVKRGRGRPKGSKNKPKQPKVETPVEQSVETVEEADQTVNDTSSIVQDSSVVA